MGIHGLLQVLKNTIDVVHIRTYAKHRVAIDAYGWLHRGCYTCAVELCTKKPTIRWLEYCISRVRMLLEYDITPIMVFDGAKLPAKTGTETDRLSKREESLLRGEVFLAENNHKQAEKCFQKAVDVTPAMAHQLIQRLHEMKIECIVAPYEADAQLAYLAKIEYVQAVISEDSDLIVFGCPRILFKLSNTGTCEEFRLRSLGACTQIALTNWDQKAIQQMCVLAGCDYLKSLPKMGIKRAHQLIRDYKAWHKALKRLKQQKPEEFPKDYEHDFMKALLTFCHQRVYDPNERKLVHLSPLPPDFYDSWPDDSFLGPSLSDELASGIANGDVDPDTKQPFAASLAAAVASSSSSSSRHILSVIPPTAATDRRSSPSPSPPLLSSPSPPIDHRTLSLVRHSSLLSHDGSTSGDDRPISDDHDHDHDDANSRDSSPSATATTSRFFTSSSSSSSSSSLVAASSQMHHHQVDAHHTSGNHINYAFSGSMLTTSTTPSSSSSSSSSLPAAPLSYYLPTTPSVSRGFVAPRSNGSSSSSLSSNTVVAPSLARLGGRGLRAVRAVHVTTAAVASGHSNNGATNTNDVMLSTISHQRSSLMNRLHQQSLRERTEHARTVGTTPSPIIPPISSSSSSSPNDAVHLSHDTSLPRGDHGGIKRRHNDMITTAPSSSSSLSLSSSSLSYHKSPNKKKAAKKPFVSPLKKPFVSNLVGSPGRLSFAGRRLAAAAAKRAAASLASPSDDGHTYNQIAMATAAALQSVSDNLTLAGIPPPLLTSQFTDDDGTHAAPICIDDDDDRAAPPRMRGIPAGLIGGMGGACVSRATTGHEYITDRTSSFIPTASTADIRLLSSPSPSPPPMNDNNDNDNDNDDDFVPSPELNPMAATQQQSIPSISLDEPSSLSLLTRNRPSNWSSLSTSERIAYLQATPPSVAVPLHIEFPALAAADADLDAASLSIESRHNYDDHNNDDNDNNNNDNSEPAFASLVQSYRVAPSPFFKPGYKHPSISAYDQHLHDGDDNHATDDTPINDNDINHDINDADNNGATSTSSTHNHTNDHTIDDGDNVDDVYHHDYRHGIQLSSPSPRPPRPPYIPAVSSSLPPSSSSVLLPVPASLLLSSSSGSPSWQSSSMNGSPVEMTPRSISPSTAFLIQHRANSFLERYRVRSHSSLSSYPINTMPSSQQSSISPRCSS